MQRYNHLAMEQRTKLIPINLSLSSVTDFIPVSVSGSDAEDRDADVLSALSSADDSNWYNLPLNH